MARRGSRRRSRGDGVAVPSAPAGQNELTRIPHGRESSGRRAQGLESIPEGPARAGLFRIDCEPRYGGPGRSPHARGSVPSVRRKPSLGAAQVLQEQGVFRPPR